MAAFRSECMDFSASPRAIEWQARLSAFMDRYLLPYNAAWHQSVQQGVFPPPFVADLKALAQEEELAALGVEGAGHVGRAAAGGRDREVEDRGRTRRLGRTGDARRRRRGSGRTRC